MDSTTFNNCSVTINIKTKLDNTLDKKEVNHVGINDYEANGT